MIIIKNMHFAMKDMKCITLGLFFEGKNYIRISFHFISFQRLIHFSQQSSFSNATLYKMP
jgi:hypothetical protein